jgi:hypothetical protein
VVPETVGDGDRAQPAAESAVTSALSLPTRKKVAAKLRQEAMHIIEQ